ncbi:MAG: hypothetical protein KDD10_06085 [Phaeodactylibacter sp.]|nr:hypothetical protein [Phaeodactylibacter sp.]
MDIEPLPVDLPQNPYHVAVSDAVAACHDPVSAELPVKVVQLFAKDSRVGTLLKRQLEKAPYLKTRFHQIFQGVGRVDASQVFQGFRKFALIKTAVSSGKMHGKLFFGFRQKRLIAANKPVGKFKIF